SAVSLLLEEAIQGDGQRRAVTLVRGPREASPGHAGLSEKRVISKLTSPFSFSVNLMCPNGDIAFHFNPRFDEESPVVVCNTWTNGKWGSEDRTLQMPFRQGEPFEMAITVQLACYEVCVNGAYLLKYAHRLPVHTVKKLEYRGGIKFEENGSPLPQVDPPPYSPPRNVAPDNGPGTDVKDDPAENVMILIPAWEETNPLDSHETPRTEDGSDGPSGE
ncbi:hypothetical protein lerEdw1_009688, partial [Lerista edwardsae]